MTHGMQEARLIASDGRTIAATVEVTAFPDHPNIVKHDGRYFYGGHIKYGVDYLTYHEVAPPVSV